VFIKHLLRLCAVPPPCCGAAATGHPLVILSFSTFIEAEIIAALLTVIFLKNVCYGKLFLGRVNPTLFLKIINKKLPVQIMVQ